MTSARASIVTLAIAVFMAACGGEAAAPPSPSPEQSPLGQTFKINPEPGVTANGTILVAPGPTSTTIQLKIISLQAASSHVSHIHLGSCQQRGCIAFTSIQIEDDGQDNADTKSTTKQRYPPAGRRW